jgi:FKBP12-rapamycin complex-associated protein
MEDHRSSKLLKPKWRWGAEGKQKHLINQHASAEAPPNVSNTSDILTRLLDEMKTADSTDALNRFANDLRLYVEAEAASMAAESFTKFMTELNSRIFTLVGSDVEHERLCGITIIDSLMDFQYKENEQLYSNYLRRLFEQPTLTQGSESQLLKRAAQAVGHLAHSGGSMASEFVEEQVLNALEWLHGIERVEQKRYAATLVLRQLALEAPTMFIQHIATFLDHIWVALRDPKLFIRESAIDAVKACLELISKRDRKWKLQWYFKLYAEVQKGLTTTNVDSIHGSLLVISELLRYSGDFMLSRFKECCDYSMLLKDSKTSIIRDTVIDLLQKLAQYSRNAFVKGYLEECLLFITNTIKNGQSRKVGFLALGSIAKTVGNIIERHLNLIVFLIDADIQSFGKKDQCSEALHCLGLLAEAVGPKLSRFMSFEFLDQILQLKLSPALIDSLITISKHIPELLNRIQDQLKVVIAKILMGASESQNSVNPQAVHLSRNSVYPSMARPTSALKRNSQSLKKQDSAKSFVVEESNPEIDSFMIILALKTLCSPTFQSRTFLPFVRDVIAQFLERDDPEIRSQAAFTCCSLLLGNGDSDEPRKLPRELIAIVNEVLERLLGVAVSDMNSSIRLGIMASLDSRYDPYLVQPYCLKFLFIALKDEELRIRSVVMSILGRIAVVNPAYVMPVLRKTLIHLLTVVEFSTDSRSREDSAILLRIMINSSEELIRPYVPAILKVILPMVGDSDSGVASAALSTVGTLSMIGGADMREHLHRVFPLVINGLQDQSSYSRREISLKTMGQVVESTGWVIEPYKNHLDLLSTLINMIKSEQVWEIRREAIKVLGTLGALDPFVHKMNILKLTRSAEPDGGKGMAVGSLLYGNQVASAQLGNDSVELNEDQFYAVVTVEAVMKILRDPSLSQHHSSVTSTVMFILKEIGPKSSCILPLIVPQFLGILKNSEESFKVSIFQNLADIAATVGTQIRPYLESILDAIIDSWNSEGVALTKALLKLIQEICNSLKDEFRLYLPRLMPLLLNVLHVDRSLGRVSTVEVLTCFQILGPYLDDYVDLIVSPMVSLFDMLDAPVEVRKKAVITVTRLAEVLTVSSYTSRIVHPLVRILNSSTPSSISLREDILAAFCVLVYRLKFDFGPFIPMIEKILAKQKISAIKYRDMVSKLLRGQLIFNIRTEVQDDIINLSKKNEDMDKQAAQTPILERLDVNQAALKKEWEASQKLTKEDWFLWTKKLSIQLVKYSPSFAIRSCQQLVQKYPPLAKDLFNVAFASCWSELYDHYQDNLMENLRIVFESPAVPSEVLQTILNVVEFMEHNGNSLPINIGKLGDLAAEAHAYAKALYYKEQEFKSSPDSSIESLISINYQLQQPSAAIGILSYAQKHLNVDLQESWYEKLQQWDDALGAYERKQLLDPGYNEATMGRMRCLGALGEWERLLSISKSLWEKTTEEAGIRSKIAPLAATAAWSLSQWHQLKEFVVELDSDGFERCFFTAIISAKEDKFDQAQLFIEKARKIICTDFVALLGESYNRAYKQAIQIQQLTELEEAVQFKTCPSKERRDLILKMWRDRLDGCQRDVDVWQQILYVRSLVVSPHEDIPTWLKFASLCRKSGRNNMSHKILVTLLGSDPIQNYESKISFSSPRVSYSFLKHMWASGYRDTALQHLRNLAIHLDSSSDFLKDGILLSRCHFRLAQWELDHIISPYDENSVSSVLIHLQKSTGYDPKCYKAIHWLALINYQLVFQNDIKDSDLSKTEGIVAAVKGFFSSIDLGGDMCFQDTLRLLNLCFRFGALPKVEKALHDGFASVSIDVWLTVIPQIIARINASKPQVRQLLHNLLQSLGQKHPQALIYPLTVASKATNLSRKSAALNLLKSMKKHSELLVDQAEMFSYELIRTAVLWHEMWHEGLEQASNMYFGSKNIEGMMLTLEPLHKMIELGSETLHEVSFLQSYGKELSEAKEWCERYKDSKNESDLNQAWELYCSVFRKIDKLVKQITDVQLQHVSPKLLQAKDLDLAVPGTYMSSSHIIKISYFHPSLKVLSSKQRPRKITLKANDGKDYNFLLKGHEDLRQDERVMQLFSLVNTLMSNDRVTSKHDYSIRGYSVIPLSPNSGLIEWLGQCDTFHDLIQEYRSRKKIILTLERLLLTSLAPDKQYQQLMVVQMVDVFEQALSCTTGQDLAAMLWLKSSNCEVWLDRRTNYIRSLAVMSMVGYILGLGDRHPCNIMLDRITGKIIHIDFGDCFEVAMQRDKFPEKIPFRLTRMLVNAMEVSGIEGTFRSTCENVMKVLRDNKESVMAVLEAFVHDPLINWRLLGADEDSESVVIGVDSSDEVTSSVSKRTRMVSSDEDQEGDTEILNVRAVEVIHRVRDKLTGKDFLGEDALDVIKQVNRLILQASSWENLSQCYVGWCPFW